VCNFKIKFIKGVLFTMKKILAIAALFAIVTASMVIAEPNPDETRNINRYGHVGLWNTHSAQTLGYSRLSLNIYGNHSMDKNFVKNVYWLSPIGDGTDAVTVISYDPTTSIRGYARETFNLSISYGLQRFLDLGVMLPVYIDWMDNVLRKSNEGVTLYS
jgi:hypothetical protein